MFNNSVTYANLFNTKKLVYEARRMTYKEHSTSIVNNNDE